MQKRDLVKLIARKLDWPATRVGPVAQATLDAIAEAIVAEGRIELRGFGVFEVRERKARKSRNVRTGEPIDVPAYKAVAFTPGLDLVLRIGGRPSVVRRAGERGKAARDGAGGGEAIETLPEQGEP